MRRGKWPSLSRRDDVDTAFWAPSLRIDANSRVHVTFTMPDPLTWWSFTGRAMDAQERDKSAHRLHALGKSLFAKWAAPDRHRAGDAPRSSVAAFNQSGKDMDEITLKSAADSCHRFGLLELRSCRTLRWRPASEVSRCLAGPNR